MRRPSLALRLVPFAALLAGLALIAPASRAEVLSPKPGEVYREFHRIMSEFTTKDWRVTQPDATHPGSSPTNSPAYYLPNAKLPFTIPAGQLAGATRAELVIDYWGGHVGTTGAKVRFNGNAWLTVPTLSGPTPPECYTQQWNPGLAVPLAHLREGTNYLEGTAGPQTCWSMNWGQWGWYAAILRVYYNPLTAGGPTGLVTSPLPGATLGESPTISVSATPAPGTSISRVEVLARYEGADWDGDGQFLEYHQAYHKAPGATTIATSRHVGTDTSAPFGMVWDTTLVPDQGNVRLLARIQASNGLWYVTPEVTGLTLDRPTASVALYKPSGVPQCFWVSAGRRNLQSKVVIPAGVNLAQATSAKLVVATWNGIDGQAEPGQHHFTRFNSWTAPNYGQNHVYSIDLLDVPVSQLRNGDNIVWFDSTSTHHGIEILWPGPHLIVRFGAPSNPVCGNRVVEAGEQCDDGNTVSGDGCQSNCTLPPPAVCGNGVREASEQCDDGNVYDGDGCQANCKFPACGDGIEDPGEACDDGNTVNGDFCQATCDLPVCGDGIVDGDEECDDDNAASWDGCQSDCVGELFLRVDKLHQTSGVPPAIRLAWTGERPRFEVYRSIDERTGVEEPSKSMGDTAEYEWSDPGTPPTDGTIAYYSVVSQCGNGAVDAGETCDDGNNLDLDGCAADCGVAAASGPNALANGGFAAGATGWYLYSNGSATLSVEGGAAHVTIASPGTNVQLLQTPVSVEGGTRYRLRFKARNTGGDDLRVQLYQHAAPNASYGLDAFFDLTAVDRQFETYFVTPAGDKTDARLSVWLADWDQAGNDYWFDDFELTPAP